MLLPNCEISLPGKSHLLWKVFRCSCPECGPGLAGCSACSWVVFNKQIFLTLELSQSKTMNALCKKLHKFHSVGGNENNVSQSFVCIPWKKKSPNKTEIVVMETSRLNKRGNTGSVFHEPGPDSFISSTCLGRESVFLRNPVPSILLQIKARPSSMWATPKWCLLRYFKNFSIIGVIISIYILSSHFPYPTVMS